MILFRTLVIKNSIQSSNFFRRRDDTHVVVFSTVLFFWSKDANSLITTKRAAFLEERRESVCVCFPIFNRCQWYRHMVLVQSARDKTFTMARFSTNQDAFIVQFQEEGRQQWQALSLGMYPPYWLWFDFSLVYCSSNNFSSLPIVQLSTHNVILPL